MNTSLLQLPGEIIERVSSCLQVPLPLNLPMLRLIQGNPHFTASDFHYRLLTALQYQIDLEVAGLEDDRTVCPELSVAERHNHLRLRNAAWDSLQWNTTDDFLIYNGPWEFLSGILVTSDGPGPFGDPNQLDTRFKFKQPRSVHAHVPERCWDLTLVGLRVHDFIIDPSQDLLVAAEDLIALNRQSCNLHLLSMTTGKKHPLAAETRIPFQPSVQPFRFTAIKFQVQGAYLGVLFSCITTVELQVELIVWDWKRGRILERISGNILAFTFLADGFLLFIGAKSALSPPTFNAIDLASGTDERTKVSDLKYVCTFEYPPLDYMAWEPTETYVEIRTDPLSFIPHTSLFRTSPADKLFVISFHGAHTESTPVLVVPLSTFMMHIRSCPSEGYDSWESRRSFAFDEWGQEGARALSNRPSDVWICYSHGMKFAVLDEDDERTHMLVYDFNRLALRKARAHPSGNPPTMEICSSPSDAGSFLNESPLPTTLPYRLTRVPVPKFFGEDRQELTDSAMISETSMIAVMAIGGLGAPTFRILSF